MTVTGNGDGRGGLGVERAFRRASGSAVATLARLFGDLDLAEEAVQDAFVVALQRWPEAGVPANPAGWIVTTAKRRAIDHLRREATRDDRQAAADRLDSALAGAGATYDDSVITVEHVLPRNPAEGSPWRRWFTDEQRAEWTHRLANLVLLARRKNSQAGNFAFAYKQRSYFRMADGVSPFALTSQVLGQTEWTPEVLERRQRALLAKLIELWRL